MGGVDAVTLLRIGLGLVVCAAVPAVTVVAVAGFAYDRITGRA